MLNTLLTILISFLVSCVVCFKLIYTGHYETHELRPLKKVFSSPLFIAVTSTLLGILGVILFPDNIPSVLIFVATLSAAYFASYFAHYFQVRLQRENFIKEEVRVRAIDLSEELYRLNGLYTKIAQYLITLEGSVVSSSGAVTSCNANSFLQLLKSQPNVAYFTLPKFLEDRLGPEVIVAKFDINGIHARQKILQCHAVFNAYALALNDYVKMITSVESEIARIGEVKFASLSNQDLNTELGNPVIQKVKFRAKDLIKLSYSAELQVRETLNYIKENSEFLVRGSFDEKEVLEYMGKIVMNSEGVSGRLDSWQTAKAEIIKNDFLTYI